MRHDCNMAELIDPESGRSLFRHRLDGIAPLIVGEGMPMDGIATYQENAQFQWISPRGQFRGRVAVGPNSHVEPTPEGLLVYDQFRIGFYDFDGRWRWERGITTPYATWTAGRILAHLPAAVPTPQLIIRPPDPDKLVLHPQDGSITSRLDASQGEFWGAAPDGNRIIFVMKIPQRVVAVEIP